MLKQEIIKTAFDAGINMFDTAEAYASGKSEEEMRVFLLLSVGLLSILTFIYRGRVIKELGLRRTDLVISTRSTGVLERVRTTEDFHGNSALRQYRFRFSINRPIF